jgi:hypothetical protein
MHMLFICHLFNYSLFKCGYSHVQIIEANHIRESSLFSLFTLLGITDPTPLNKNLVLEI